MSLEINNYQTAEGLDDEQMSALLSSRLDRTIGVAGYRIIKGRKDAPLEWLEALNIAPREPPPRPETKQHEEDRAAAETQPQPASSSPLPFEVVTAQAQIELAYVAAGKGAAYVLHAPQVAPLWAAAAPEIAAAYIAWARENETVARVIAMVTLGGPMGQVVLLHGSLVVMTLIVSGQVDPAQFMPPMRQPQETDTIGDLPVNDDDIVVPVVDGGGGEGADDEKPKPRPRQRKRT